MKLELFWNELFEGVIQGLAPLYGAQTRKGSFGSQSDAGARYIERIYTVTQTLKAQGRELVGHLRQGLYASQVGAQGPKLLT